MRCVLQEIRGGEGGSSASGEAAPSQEAVTAQLAESRTVLQSLQVPAVMPQSWHPCVGWASDTLCYGDYHAHVPADSS